MSTNKVWAPVNPYINVKCKTQSQQKIMVWVGLCSGQMIGPYWIEQKMDNSVYHEFLTDKIWPSNCGKVTKNQLWFQQDGAICHTNLNNLDFHLKNFNRHVILIKSEISWPVNSPDLNPLDFFFWGY